MRLAISILFLALTLSPSVASAAAVWQDDNLTNAFFTGEASSYYNVGADVLATLKPGSYNFSLDYMTIGGGDTDTLLEDHMVAIAEVSPDVFRTMESTLRTENLYNISLDFEVKQDMSFLNDFGKLIYFVPFIKVLSETTAWQATSAQITSPTPIPGAIWMLSSGLAALIGIRKRYNS